MTRTTDGSSHESAQSEPNATRQPYDSSRDRLLRRVLVIADEIERRITSALRVSSYSGNYPGAAGEGV